jgi:SNF2 family DNA or RNA helicase
VGFFVQMVISSIELTSSRYYHVITKDKCRVRPEERGGGILADEMGMGKSLSILALIVHTLEDGETWAHDQRNSDDTNKTLQYSRATLVVVSSARTSMARKFAVSVANFTVVLINNWFKEIQT